MDYGKPPRPGPAQCYRPCTPAAKQAWHREKRQSSGDLGGTTHSRPRLARLLLPSASDPNILTLTPRRLLSIPMQLDSLRYLDKHTPRLKHILCMVSRLPRLPDQHLVHAEPGLLCISNPILPKTCVTPRSGSFRQGEQGCFGSQQESYYARSFVWHPLHPTVFLALHDLRTMLQQSWVHIS